VLADPAWGNRSMPIDAFLRAWIDFPQWGRIGFLIRRSDGQPATDNLLALPPESVR
jgi:hypothetical protein